MDVLNHGIGVLIQRSFELMHRRGTVCYLKYFSGRLLKKKISNLYQYHITIILLLWFHPDGCKFFGRVVGRRAAIVTASPARSSGATAPV